MQAHQEPDDAVAVLFDMVTMRRDRPIELLRRVCEEIMILGRPRTMMWCLLEATDQRTTD